MFKRALLCIALAISLCLGLCACDAELPQEQLDILQGTWFNDRAFDGDGTVDDGVPYLIQLSTDGTCSFNGEGGMTWEGKVIKDTGNLELKIRQEKKVIHTFTIESFESDGKTVYQAYLADKKGEEWFGSFMKADSAEPYADWMAKVEGEWYPNGQGDASLPLTIHADGTCSVDGKSYQWALQPNYYSSQDNVFRAFVYDNQQTCYYFRAEFNTTSKIVRVVLFDTNGNWLSEYDFHPLKSIFLSWYSWTPFDRYNTVATWISLNDSNLGMSTNENSEDLTWEISESTTDEQIVVCAPDAAAPEYVISMYMNGEYPQMALEVKATGEVINYYISSDEYGYDPANPEALYYEARKAIKCYLEDNSFWYEVKNEDGSFTSYSLYDEDILSYAYSKFLEVADYKDSQSYLDRFTIYENKLVSALRATTDKMGNDNENENYYRYSYDTDGRLSYFFDSAYVEIFGVQELRNYSASLTYDANGVVTEVVLKSGSSIYAKCTPTYDGDGKLISMHVQKNNEEYTSTFTYNEQGQLAQLEIPYYSNNPYTYTYTYDEAGNLIQKDYYYTRSNHYTTTYTYANGLLAQETRNVTEYGDEYVVTCNYTYDEAGNLLTKSYTSTNPDYSLTKEEFTCIYKDVYFYATE